MEPSEKENNEINKKLKEWLTSTKKLAFNKDISSIIELMAPGMNLLSEARIGAFAFEYETASYSYFNDYFAEMMQMSRADIEKEGFAIMRKNVHPEDFLKCLNITGKSSAEFKKMKEHEKKSFHFRLFYRLRNGKDQYAWVLQVNTHVSLNGDESRLDIGYIMELFDSERPIRVMGILETNSRRLELYPDGEMDLLALLTLRELEVLQLIKQGLGSKEIAEALSIAENTVKAHRRKLMSKLKVRNMVQAAGMLDKLS
jgi:DNA-binding CsgD family transcriptional regulator